MSGGQHRRHKRQFEPPPWEHDAFERFQREREEQEQEAALQAALSEIHGDTEPTIGPEALEEPAVPAETVAEPASPAPGVGASERDATVSAAELEELMAHLRIEEPRTDAQYDSMANAVTALLLVGGLGFVVWSGILLARAGQGAGGLQMVASLLVMVWGFMMIAFAVMLWRKRNLG